MWDFLKALVDNAFDAIGKRPVWTLGVFLVLLLAMFMAAGLLMEGALEPFWYGAIYLLLMCGFTAIIFNSHKMGRQTEAGRVFRFGAMYMAPVLLLVTGTLFLAWFFMTTHRYFAEYDQICDAESAAGAEAAKADAAKADAAKADAAKADTGAGKGGQSEKGINWKVWFARLTGIKRIETDCAATIYELTWTAERKVEGKEVSVVLPFSHRRSSCSGKSEGVFSACVPSGYNIEPGSIEIRNISQRNGGVVANGGIIRSDRDMTDEILKDIFGDKPEQCVNINWEAASGGRTGIGECRYHGYINFEVALVGIEKSSKDESKGESRSEDTVSGRGVMGRHFIPIPSPIFETGAERDAFYQSYKDGGYNVELQVLKKRHMRRNVLWRDYAAKGAENSTCISLAYLENPHGFFVTNKCSDGPKAVKE